MWLQTKNTTKVNPMVTAFNYCLPSNYIPLSSNPLEDVEFNLSLGELFSLLDSASLLCWGEVA